MLTALKRLKRRRQRLEKFERLGKLRFGEEKPISNKTQSVHRISVYHQGRIRHGLARERKPMPELFCLSQNHDAVVTFLSELRHKLVTSGGRFDRLRLSGGALRSARNKLPMFDEYIDFASMREITPAAALVLASEYDRIKTVFNAPNWLRAINIENWEPNVLTTLDDLGFLPMLGVDRPRTTIANRDGVYVVPFLAGTKVLGDKIDGFIRTLGNFAVGRGLVDGEALLNRSRVYDGLGEAIQNVEDHAYPPGTIFPYPMVKKWWMTGAVEPGKKRFNLMVYDQGISIPARLPRWDLFADFKAAFLATVGRDFDPESLDKDGETIAEAVQVGRSSTGKSWHGKGLPLMREIVDNSAGGTLHILSRCGEYTYTAGKRPVARSFTVPIAGTLVEWDLYL